MDNLSFRDDDYEVRAEKRRQRMEAQKKKAARQRKIVFGGAALLLLLIIIGIVIIVVVNINRNKVNKSHKVSDESIEDVMDGDLDDTGEGNISDISDISGNSDVFVTDDDKDGLVSGSDDLMDNPDITSSITEAASIIYESRRFDLQGEDYIYTTASDYSTISNDEFVSSYGILINTSDNTVIAGCNGDSRMNPASMTKILTVLTARQYISDEELDSPVTVTQAAVDYSLKNGCSSAGFEPGEIVTVRDLFYGTVLSSGAEAAYTLAQYVAGDHEIFVELMNINVKSLGISDTTHFTNCVGIYNDNHYTTCRDIAVILDAAMHTDDFMTELMGARKYTTSYSNVHEEGIDISNWFLRRIEDKDTLGYVSGAKTGFVNESGCCGASFMNGNDGNDYICVTGNAWSSWRCIYDHVCVYNVYAMGNTSYKR